MYPIIRSILVYLYAIFAALPWVRLPTPGTLRSPLVLTLGDMFASWAASDAGDVIFAPLWISYPPDPLAKWAWSGERKHGYWSYGSVNASVDGPVLPYTLFINIETILLPLFGPIFEEHTDSATPLGSADNVTMNADDAEHVPPSSYDDPLTAQCKVVWWSALSFILVVAAVLPRDSPQLAKRWLDSISGKSAREADHGALLEVLRERARVYEEHQAALAEHDKKLIALAGCTADIDDWPVEDMWGVEDAEAALGIVLDECEVLEVRLASLDVHHPQLASTRREEVAALQASCETYQQEVDGVRSELANQDREDVARDEAHEAYVAELKTKITASEVKIQTTVGRLASATRDVSTLNNTLDTVRNERHALEAESTGLRRHYSHAEEALARNRILRKKKLEALRAAIADQEAALRAAADRETAATVRQDALQEQFSSVTADAREAEESLKGDLTAKRLEVAAVSKMLVKRQAVTTDLNLDHRGLLSAHDEKTDRIHTLEHRVASAQDTLTILRGELEDARQAHQYEINELADDVTALRSAEAATTHDVEAVEETLRQAEQHKTTKVGAAQAELDRAEAEDKKAIATLESQPRRQAQHLTALDARQNALRAEQDSLETQGRELEACFDEHGPQWREMQEDVADLEARQDEQLREYKEKFAEAEEVQCTAEKAAQVAKDEAQAAGKKAAEDKEEHKERQKNFDTELARLRRTNGTLASENSALKSEHGPLKAANSSLVEQATTIPGDHAAALDDFAGFVHGAEAERDKKLASRKVTAAISRREALLENAQNTVACLQDTADVLDGLLTEAHGRMYEEREALEKVEAALELEERKAETYRAVLQTPVTTPSLVDSSGRFSCSPSLTPPPETPRSDASVGCPAAQDESMDIAESGKAWHRV